MRTSASPEQADSADNAATVRMMTVNLLNMPVIMRPGRLRTMLDMAQRPCHAGYQPFPPRRGGSRSRIPRASWGPAQALSWGDTMPREWHVRSRRGNRHTAAGATDGGAGHVLGVLSHESHLHASASPSSDESHGTGVVDTVNGSKQSVGCRKAYSDTPHFVTSSQRSPNYRFRVQTASHDYPSNPSSFPSSSNRHRRYW